MSLSPITLTFAQIAELTHAVKAPMERTGGLRAVSSIEEATATSVVFAQNESTLLRAIASSAGLILAAKILRERAEAAAIADARLLWVEDARLGFSRVARALRPKQGITEIHTSAVVAASACIGSRVRISAGVVVGEFVTLGDDVQLEPRVVIHAGARLGARVEVHAGCVLGGAGFGWAHDPRTGEYISFPQQGGLIIEDDVSIGANCTIDRGALGNTRIGKGTKIDNLVHIAHSCTIGRGVVIAAQTGIAGSSVIGDGAVIAGQVGIADHVEIGEGVVLGAKCGVPSHKVLRGPGQVFWGIPARPIQQYLRELALLRRGL